MSLPIAHASTDMEGDHPPRPYLKTADPKSPQAMSISLEYSVIVNEEVKYQ